MAIVNATAISGFSGFSGKNPKHVNEVLLKAISDWTCQLRKAGRLRGFHLRFTCRALSN